MLQFGGKAACLAIARRSARSTLPLVIRHSPFVTRPSTFVPILFNSRTFVVFFEVVVTAYWSMRSWNARKNLLVVASYIFYGAWNPPFAALLDPQSLLLRRNQ
jgi:hypothetical protein